VLPGLADIDAALRSAAVTVVITIARLCTEAAFKIISDDGPPGDGDPAGEAAHQDPVSFGSVNGSGWLIAELAGKFARVFAQRRSPESGSWNTANDSVPSHAAGRACRTDRGVNRAASGVVVMADSNAVMQRRKRAHAQGDHHLCRAVSPCRKAAARVGAHLDTLADLDGAPGDGWPGVVRPAVGMPGRPAGDQRWQPAGAGQKLAAADPLLPPQL
jgi:hypothetical protein